MPSRSICSILVAFGALFAPLLSTPTATASETADYIIRVSPDRGAVGDAVTIYGLRDPEPERTVVWRCDHLGADDRIIGDATADNGSWEIRSTVPADCVTQPSETGDGQVWLTTYGNSPETFFTITDTPADCPAVLFIGAHGINEGAKGGAPTEAEWGSTIDAVWKHFSQSVPGARAAAGDYPRTQVDLLSLNTPLQVRSLQPAADEAAIALETQVIDQFVRCGTRTRIMLAGFSLGGWAVDKTLRSLHRSPAGRAALPTVAGAGVIGDPAYPQHMCGVPCREGLATWAGLGYSTESTYLDNWLTSRFMSICVSYSETNRDPICGVRSPVPDLNPTNIAAHLSYPSSGGTSKIADFLAGLTH
jgi:Cutinase